MYGYLGIDPGAKGFLCLLVPETKMTFFYPNPTKWSQMREAYNWLSYQEIDHVIEVAGIEDVHSLYGMSAASNFKFGFNLGLVHALVGIFEVCEVKLVQPKAWQRGVGVTAKGKDIKQNVADLANKLYPDAELYGPKGGLLDGRADALMIAHYIYLQDQDNA
jgi:hypothetical protein